MSCNLKIREGPENQGLFFWGQCGILGPQHRPQYVIILVMGTPKQGPRIVGNSHVTLNPSMLATGKVSPNTLWSEVRLHQDRVRDFFGFIATKGFGLGFRVLGLGLRRVLGSGLGCIFLGDQNQGRDAMWDHQSTVYEP